MYKAAFGSKNWEAENIKNLEQRPTLEKVRFPLKEQRPILEEMRFPQKEQGTTLEELRLPLKEQRPTLEELRLPLKKQRPTLVEVRSPWRNKKREARPWKEKDVCHHKIETIVNYPAPISQLDESCIPDISVPTPGTIFRLSLDHLINSILPEIKTVFTCFPGKDDHRASCQLFLWAFQN